MEFWNKGKVKFRYLKNPTEQMAQLKCINFQFLQLGHSRVNVIISTTTAYGHTGTITCAKETDRGLKMTYIFLYLSISSRLFNVALEVGPNNTGLYHYNDNLYHIRRPRHT